MFVIYTFVAALQILNNHSPNPSRILPSRPALNCIGIVIGWISSFVGIGGGMLSVPFLVYCKINTKRTIGTSSVIGLLIALAGAIVYIVSGLQIMPLLNHSLGFVYLPAFAIIALASLISAPIGAVLVQKLSVKKLKRIFALLLIAIGCNMLLGLISS